MSVSIPGKLNVIERNGRSGPFMVAELITDIGCFDLKNRVLDQYEQGTYEGIFVITKIYNQSVAWKNGTWTKLCADLDWEQLRIMAQTSEPIQSTTIAVAEMVAESEVQTLSPVENQVQPPVSTPTQVAEQASPAFSDDDLVINLESLKEKIALGLPVKLDGTMDDRDLFRELRAELKNNGYGFDGRSQSWSLR